MVSAWINHINDAEKQIELFEKKIAGHYGFVEKTINDLLNLRDKARDLARDGDIDAVHETYLEMSSLWKMLRGVESAIRSRYPMLSALFDVLVYIFHLGIGNNWSIVGMLEQLVLDGWPYIEELFAKIIASRTK